MKQSYSLAFFTAVELEVGQILLDLPELIVSSQWKLNFSWGEKRRRSCLDAPPQLLRTPWREVIEEITPQIAPTEASEKNKDEQVTVSPNTPFSFSQSESDVVKSASPLTTKKTPKKSSMKEYVDSVEGLTRDRDLLCGELKNVKEYYKKLKAFHSQLKAIKVEVLNSITTCSRKGDYSSTRHMTHTQPFDAYPTAENHQVHSSGNGTGQIHERVPLLFDLNQPAEEEFCSAPFQSHPFDVNRAVSYERSRCAEARRKRRVIIKSKSSRSFSTVKVQKDLIF